MLVGDAGYWKDPISAHGITDALRDAELVATAIVGAIGCASAQRDVADGGLPRTAQPAVRTSCSTSPTGSASAKWTDDEVPGLLKAINASTWEEVTHLDDLGHLTPGAIFADAR